MTGDNKSVIWPLRAQGDAPRDTLLTWFRTTPNSVLLATRSFWEGVDIPGDNLSLVVLDKMPFPTPGDPLHSARMKAIDDDGRSSFNEYMTPLMTLALKQGFGRLIRRATDRGVVAILDERLTSKSYGRQARTDLPPARFSREFKDVHKFFQSALQSRVEFALNVWASEGRGAGSTGQGASFASLKDKRGRGQGTDDDDEDAQELQRPEGTRIQNPKSEIRWRWQALRLQDGKRDSQEGSEELPDVVAGEIHAAVLGLRDLRQRIERAGRQASQFRVEVRCSAGMATMVNINQAALPLLQTWQSERQLWHDVVLLVTTNEKTG
jgi:ATP-dependent DNA helicase DinG